VSSADSGTVVQKDYEVTRLLGHIVRVMVSDMIGDGILREGLHYSAVVIPRYEGSPQHTPVAFVDEQPRHKRDGWLNLEFDGEPQPDTPISFCTLEVRVAEKTITCRKDFQLKIELSSILVDEDSARGAVVPEKGEYTYQLFAREDNESSLELEKGHLRLSKAEADELVEISPLEEPTVALPEKCLDDFEVEEVVGVKPPPESVQIVITRSALNAVQKIARNGAKVEEGGVLVGNVFTVPSSSAHLVEISAQIFAEEARGTEFELRYTFESWQKRTAELKENFPGRRVVGWYHTHLLKAKVFDEEHQQMSVTEHFFSSSDHFMHRQFFPEKWYVAMVLNPVGEAAFFQWDGNEIARAKGFYVVKDEIAPER
jgi:hypothetical protein